MLERWNRLSVRHKLIICLLLCALLPTVLVAGLGLQQARDVYQNRVETSDIPNLLNSIRHALNAEIGEMMTVADTIAHAPAYLDVASRPGEQAEQMVAELGQLARRFNLSNASFADRQTARYWNQDGFLRVLDQTSPHDAWFFSYRDSGVERSAEVYVEPATGEANLFVNVQQLNGRGLSGVSRSFNAMQRYLANFELEQSGFVFLVDAQGDIRVHPDNTLVNSANLRDIYGQSLNIRELLQHDAMGMLKPVVQGQSMLVAAQQVDQMGWYVVAQIPLDELMLPLNQTRNRMILIAAVVMGLVITLGIALAISLTRPIEHLADTMQALGSQGGDLRARLPEEGSAELRAVTSGVNAFIGQVQAIVRDVEHSAEEVRTRAVDSARSAADSENANHALARHTQELATALHEISQSVKDVAGSASEASKRISESDENTRQSLAVLSDTQTVIEQLAEQVGTVSDVVSTLAEQSQGIDKVLEVIGGVSEQTNLLALNAAIEAARAGDQGRGFAVVADEVRQLAQRSHQAADEIHQMITTLQRQAEHAQQVALQSQEIADEGRSSTQRGVEYLRTLQQGMQSQVSINQEVASAAQQQAIVLDDIEHKVVAIQQMSEQGENAAQDSATQSEQMRQLADRLGERISQFQV